MATVLVAADNHYYRDAKGDVYVDSVFNYDFYKRYLSVFDMVYAVGRVSQVETAPAGKKRADGPGVEFLDLEPGRGLSGFVQTAAANKRLVKGYLGKADCIIARIPGVVANMVVAECEREGLHYSIEVVVDPWEYFAPEARGGLVNWVVRRKWTAGLKAACLHADGASYVTEHYLQERYPCPALKGEPGHFTGSYSSVELPDDSFGKPRSWTAKEQYEIVHAANTFQGNAKGHYVLFDAVKMVVDSGSNVRLTCIGDGPSLGDYKAYVAKLGIADRVVFTGRLSDGAAVRKRMAEADLFVFPTKAEGLPRVLLEAMAEGLPCLSTPVCGIPEVLPSDVLFAPDDSIGFARGIVSFVSNPSKMDRASVDNIAVARNYASSILNRKRTEFYRNVALLSKEGIR